MTRQQSAPNLYQSTPHTCPYLQGETAANLLIDPQFKVTPAMYDKLIRNGFRRNGAVYYRPHCPTCHQCQSVRIQVNKFVPGKSFRRIQTRNSDVAMELCALGFREEHFALYRAYQSQRHHGDSMDDPDPEKYQQFLARSQVETFMIELRIGRRLLAVSVLDHVADGLSAVYTFFDPTQARRSPGTLAILRQIELTRSVEYNWLYLGYWIPDCEKMTYKTRFRPLEAFDSTAITWAHVC